MTIENLGVLHVCVICLENPPKSETMAKTWQTILIKEKLDLFPQIDVKTWSRSDPWLADQIQSFVWWLQRPFLAKCQTRSSQNHRMSTLSLPRHKKSFTRVPSLHSSSTVINKSLVQQPERLTIDPPSQAYPSIFWSTFQLWNPSGV